MSIIIGLTGPTGSGKSSAATLCKRFGLKHINCDILARKAVEKGTDGLKALVLAFGVDILEADGSLNRKALAKKAFSNSQNTALLNNTILPYIKVLVLKEVQNTNALLDAPTLFESGIDAICFKTIAVLANSEIRLSRITKRDNLTTDEANLRISAGKKDDFYQKNANYVIYNNNGQETFLKEFESVLSKILSQGENL